MRDLAELERRELMVKDKYKGNIGLLHGYMPIRKMLKNLKTILQQKVFNMLLTKGKITKGNDRHALKMASFRVPRLLRRPYLARR